MIQDKLIIHALKQIYSQVLPEGRHPQCVLYLELSPEMVDINVHPTKQEVRFEQPRLIYDFMLSCLRPYWCEQQAFNLSKPASASSSVGSQFSTSISTSMSGGCQPWMICNVEFVILPLSHHLFYLVDVKQWWLYHFQKQVMSWNTPWDSRALSMPYLKDIPPLSSQIRQAIEIRVAQWGIDLSFWDDSRLCIRSIPQFMCQLNLNEWVKIVKSNMNIEDINITHLFRCCTFSAYDLTASHYEMMVDDISNPEDIENIKLFARLLDHSSCRKVFK
jgi:DNA mismatch repair protein MutL